MGYVGRGSTTQVLADNAAGTLPNFQNSSIVGAFKVINRQVFTNSGTYTPTAGMVYCVIEVVGGGGGGGGTAGNGVLYSGGSGGGGGGYANIAVSAATIGASKSVTVGAGGAGATTEGVQATTGGTSSVGVIVSATGGTGGIGQTPNLGVVNGISPAPGVGGSGASGDFNITGSTGGIVIYLNTNSGYYQVWTGAGGNSFLGYGGAAINGFFYPPAINASFNGNNGIGYGGAGSGSCITNSSGAAPAVVGGNGAAGVVIITEYLN